MLEYFTVKKVKKDRAAKAAAAEGSDVSKDDRSKHSDKGKGRESPKSSSPRSSPRKTSTSSRGSASAKPGLAPSSTSTSLAGSHQVLREEDERFFRRVVSGEDHGLDETDDDGPRPTLPPRIKTPSLYWDSDDDDDGAFVSSRRESSPPKGKGKEKSRDVKEPEKDKDRTREKEASKGKGKEKAAADEGFIGGLSARARDTFSLVQRKVSIRGKKTAEGLKPKPVSKSKDKAHLGVPDASSAAEADKERQDLSSVLDDLNFSAKNNRAISLSKDSAELVQRFTLILKDIVNGVPTAAGDLQALLTDADGTLARNYEKLPSSLKKIVTSLPGKLTGSLAPELLMVASEAQGVKLDKADISASKSGALKKMLMPGSVQELITKPGAIVGMLKAIMNVLKVRWPAFIGTNVLWSVAVSLLLFVLWYCHKRGREVRLEREKSEQSVTTGRVEELPDDPALPPPNPLPADDPFVSGRATGADPEVVKVMGSAGEARQRR